MAESVDTGAPTRAGLAGVDGYPHVWAGAFPTTSLEVETTGSPRAGEFGAALAELALTVKREGSLDEQRAWSVIAETAAAIIPGAQQSAVVVDGPSGLRVRAGHGGLTVRLAAAELLTGQGPSTVALAGSRAVRTADVRRDDRWPLLALEVAGWDVGGALCTPLVAQGHGFGLLTLISGDIGAFDEQAEALAAVLAAHAAVAIIGVRDLYHVRAMAETRDVIGQAKGILMERESLTAADAFARLVTISQHTNQKLRDVCHGLATTGRLGR